MAGKLPQNDGHSTAGQVLNSDLSDLTEVLYGVAHIWERFGTALHINFDTIQSIKRKPASREARDKMILVLVRIRKRAKQPLQWETIVKAVRGIKNIALAERLPQTGDIKYNEDEYIDKMLEKLKEVIPDWKMFGLHLGLPPDELREIDSDTRTTEECFYDLLCTWIKVKGSAATVSELKRACRNVGDIALAQRLETNEKIKKIMNCH